MTAADAQMLGPCDLPLGEHLVIAEARRFDPIKEMADRGIRF